MTMAQSKYNKLPVDRLYEGRQQFSIIGLTGMAGSGCSTLASYMSSKDYLKQVRNPKDICVVDYSLACDDNELSYQNDPRGVGNKSIGDSVFKQKYSICYEFAQEYYKEYRVLKYTHVLWLYVLLFAKKSLKICNTKNLKKLISNLLIDKYQPSCIHGRDNDYKKILNYSDTKRKENISRILRSYKKWEALCKKLNDLNRAYVDDLDDSKVDVGKIALFINKGGVFEDFVNYLLKELAKDDYYSLCFLHHRLATQIRSCGDPTKSIIDDTNCQCLYNVAKLINILIKGIKQNDKKKECRVVIDSLRNSLEARYFKERYTAFYLICVNDSEGRELRLRNSIERKMPKTKKSTELLNLVVEMVKKITTVELKSNDFSKGKFASPDVENVIADAEIHINNSVEKSDQKQGAQIYDFNSMAEQWMKYSSLILHPGLITPSAEERCMVVAYTAKFNSSCLSRQVGAVITNQYHSIRTIGWNEVPYGQMPCGLRELHLINSDDFFDCQHIYSEFEREPNKNYGDKSFIDKVSEGYFPLHSESFVKKRHSFKKPVEIKGLPFSYCFKSLHNTFEGEKNQVYTRSLHAEENAILQMAKYGGEPLMNGVIYVTASPCELCAKKLYQIGVRKIIYIDPYPGISMKQIIKAGFKRPHLKLFQGAYGASYFKLYQPFMSYKDELWIRLGHKGEVLSKSKLLDSILKEFKIDSQPSYTKEEIKKIVSKISGKKQK